MENKLSQLKKMTLVVADTGDIDAMKQYQPEDATTNPSLIYRAAQMDKYEHLVRDAIRWAQDQGGNKEQIMANTVDQLAVSLGSEILKIIPGRISTEVDSRLSFDIDGTIQRARKLISLYHDRKIPAHRVLIKIAATWEGIKAAEILEKENIQCNLTLLFGFGQAVACAEAGVFLISPFVGRILDWYKKTTGRSDFAAEEDPGVQSVTTIYNYYKKFDHQTIVMGASFRNHGQIEQLAGCDRLTISPQLLKILNTETETIPRKLSPAKAKKSDLKRIEMDEKRFRWMLNDDAMSTEKLAEGIRIFTEDIRKLETFILDFNK
ncbi:MAG: transaldolase [SAR324 cluster bacterium]|nr:transaldolase [SAR324 cluster bacterium]